jgi:hypothetical protein
MLRVGGRFGIASVTKVALDEGGVHKVGGTRGEDTMINGIVVPCLVVD